jgi:metacaspase-1
MTKKAFCVGVNNYPYGDENDLRGCINDANAWANMLRDHFNFTDVRVAKDEDATQAKIIEGVKGLLAKAKSGDVLVFTNSSHGTYLADTSGDEPGYDEAICPYDMKDNGMLVDDTLREIFVGIPKGVRFTVISDSCHSGSVTRVVQDGRRRNRMLSPLIWGGHELTPQEMADARKKKAAAEKYPESGMKEILLSGCKSNQTSADAYIDSISEYYGAMSYYAMQTIKDANYKLTYAQLHARLLPTLEDQQYNQVPQLEGKDTNKRRQIFT